MFGFLISYCTINLSSRTHKFRLIIYESETKFPRHVASVRSHHPLSPNCGRFYRLRKGLHRFYRPRSLLIRCMIFEKYSKRRSENDGRFHKIIQLLDRKITLKFYRKSAIEIILFLSITLRSSFDSVRYELTPLRSTFLKI